MPSLSHPQQQKSDQRDGDLDADGVFAGAEEAADLEDLLDPAEEQLDRPAALVEISNLLRRGIQIVGQNAQQLAGLRAYPDLAHRVGHRVLPPVAQPNWQEADAVGQDGAVLGQRQFLDELLAAAGASVDGDDVEGFGFGAGQLAGAAQQLQETQMSFNLQYLQLQSQMQAENRSYTAVSNIMKTKHDTVKNSISNIR